MKQLVVGVFLLSALRPAQALAQCFLNPPPCSTTASTPATVATVINNGVGTVIVVRNNAGGTGIRGESPRGVGVEGTSQVSPGVHGVSARGAGVEGFSTEDDGVFGQGKHGVEGRSVGTGNVSGVSGSSRAGFAGVEAHGEQTAFGLFAQTSGNADAVHAETSGSTSAIYGKTTGVGYAGFFEGRVEVRRDLTVAGTLRKSSGMFRIDHPLDPANKYLNHSFVESPDMMNIYNGNVMTDDNGVATVVLPSYFQSLNRDFRYQLTVIGQFAQAIVAREVENNSFQIQTDKPGVKVSWQVTGVRKDRWAEAHRVVVEEDKGLARGYYLAPELFGAEADRDVIRAGQGR